MCENGADIQLLADGCTALLQSVFGDNNWYRWNEIKQQTQHDSLQTFITWMLDVAEQEINRPDGAVADVSAAGYDEDGCPLKQTDFDVPHVTSVSIRRSGGHHGLVQQQRSAVGGAAAGRGDRAGGTVKRESVAPHATAHGAAAAELYYSTAGGGSHPAVPAAPTPTAGVPAAGVPAGGGESAGVEIVYQPAARAFFCSACSVSLSDVEIVGEHMRLRHSSLGVTVSCFCCGQVFSALDDYVHFHAANAKQTSSNKGLVCNYCAKSFKDKQLLEDHIANKHHKTGPRHECPGCAKKFSHACNRNKHKRSCPALLLMMAQQEQEQHPPLAQQEQPPPQLAQQEQPPPQ